MRSVMSHNFSQVPKVEIPRSSFNRSHGYKTTFDAGYLVPIFVDEVLPGDTFNLNATLFGRLATPTRPVMDNMYLDTFFFFVPNRLVWSNFRKFCGEQVDPGDSTDYSIPVVTCPGTGFATGSIYDYFGLPVGTTNADVNNLPARGYNLIWNEWFRDQNLQDSATVDLGDGPDTDTDYVLLRRGKRHDYFTSCLPWPVKSDDVDLPLGTSADILVDSFAGANLDGNYYVANRTGGTNYHNTSATKGAAGSAISDGDSMNLYADLTNATAATINAVRLAFQTQKMYERDARGGTRYVEIVKSHFGVSTPDLTYRPEYLGGGQSRINVTPVPATNQSATVDQGELAGFGTVSAINHGFTKSFTEHGYIIGMASVRADLTYQQGINRMWSRDDRLDFYWPSLAHIGEQSVLNKEIYFNNDANDDLVFGYQERFAEYRYKPSLVTGLMRSTPTAGSSLDVWHLSEEFSSLPSLDSSFIVSNPPIDRVIAVSSEPHLILDCYFNLTCARPMPVYSVPGLLDHF